jgi:hypothetical protein
MMIQQQPIYSLRVSDCEASRYLKPRPACVRPQVSLLPPEEAEAARGEHLHILLANRSAAYQQLQQFDKAAADAEGCTQVGRWA